MARPALAYRISSGADLSEKDHVDTFKEEYMSRSILLVPIREVLDNSVHIVTGRH